MKHFVTSFDISLQVIDELVKILNMEDWNPTFEFGYPFIGDGIHSLFFVGSKETCTGQKAVPATKHVLLASVG